MVSWTAGFPEHEDRHFPPLSTITPRPSHLAERHRAGHDPRVVEIRHGDHRLPSHGEPYCMHSTQTMPLSVWRGEIHRARSQTPPALPPRIWWAPGHPPAMLSAAPGHYASPTSPTAMPNTPHHHPTCCELRPTTPCLGVSSCFWSSWCEATHRQFYCCESSSSLQGSDPEHPHP